MLRDALTSQFRGRELIAERLTHFLFDAVPNERGTAVAALLTIDPDGLAFRAVCKLLSDPKLSVTELEDGVNELIERCWEMLGGSPACIAHILIRSRAREDQSAMLLALHRISWSVRHRLLRDDFDFESLAAILQPFVDDNDPVVRHGVSLWEKVCRRAEQLRRRVEEMRQADEC